MHGVVVTAMMLGHCADIGSRLYIGRGYDGAAMTYNVRIYSLFLLGGVLVTCGVQLLRAAFAIASAAPRARRMGLRWAGLALLVVAPLLPIQLFFAIVHTVLACITLPVLAVTADARVIETAPVP